MLNGRDSKRHRVCHPCLKDHLASGRTREDRVSRMSYSRGKIVNNAARSMLPQDLVYGYDF